MDQKAMFKLLSDNLDVNVFTICRTYETAVCDSGQGWKPWNSP